MKPKELLDILTDNDVINILAELGSSYPRKVQDGYLFQTVCHNDYGGKFKLHYHSDTKNFHCYTECNSIGNIFSLIMKVKNCEFKEAYTFLCEKLNINISIVKHGFEDTSGKTDVSFINKFKIKKEKIELNVFDEKVLRNFEDLYHYSWIEDNINCDIMKEFNIKFDILNNRIIIPCYDDINNLIGIRCRNFNEKLLEEGKKYMPIVHEKVLYNFPTSATLYGLNINKENIKKYRKVILVESEKSVMQYGSYFKDNICIAISGSAISTYQIELLRKYECETIVLALDKEFEKIDTKEEEIYKTKIQKAFINKLLPYFNVEVIWDVDNLLDKKDSPTDKGKDIFLKLYKKRILV